MLNMVLETSERRLRYEVQDPVNKRSRAGQTTYVYYVVLDIQNPLHRLVELVDTTYFGLHKYTIL
jgi:hypothetical protein